MTVQCVRYDSLTAHCVRYDSLTVQCVRYDSLTAHCVRYSLPLPPPGESRSSPLPLYRQLGVKQV